MPEDTDMTEFLLSNTEPNVEATPYLLGILDDLEKLEKVARTGGFVETAVALKSWVEQERAKIGT
jgi:hypothetical protein